MHTTQIDIVPTSDDDDLTLPQSTLAALNSFLEEQSATQQALAALSAQSCSQGQDTDGSGDATAGSDENVSVTSQLISLHNFKSIFKEDWQLSQFWYTEDTANRLSNALIKITAPNARIAFLCCPTGYVAFKQKALPTQDILLFEYDTRFTIFSKAAFVRYDLDEPLSFSGVEELKESQDVLVIDHPFHAEASQRKIAITAAHVLRPGGCVVLLTGLSLSPMIGDIYSTLPELRRRDILIEHDGVGRLATPYACWVGGNDENDAFGALVMDDVYLGDS